MWILVIMQYFIAFLIFLVALAGRFIILPIEGGLGFLTFFPAMALTAMICGPGPCIMVIVLGGFSAYYVFMEPFWSFKANYAAITPLSVFALSGVIVCLIEQRNRHLQKGHSLLAAIVTSSDDAIASKSLDGIITSWNPAAERLFGYPVAEAIGQPMTMLFPPDRLEEEVTLLKRVSKGETITRYETIRIRKDGTSVEVSVTLSPIFDRYERIEGASKIVTDITASKLAERELIQTARYDTLTGLPNRVMFQDFFTKALSRALRGNYNLALLFLDLDGFKDINDAHGHLTGDSLLQQVAERLLSCTRTGDLISRFGGDEFTIVLEDCRAAQLTEIAKKIIEVLERPFDLDGVPAQISTSIGVSVYPEDGTDEVTLIQLADDAMYAVKKDGKRGYKFASKREDALQFQ